MLAFRLLWRNWRSGEIRILAGALMLAVAVVTAISVFTNRLEAALVQESASFMGADAIVGSSQAFSDEFIASVQPRGLDQAFTVEFISMVFSSDSNNLASVKAVSDNYPLRGRLQVSQRPFAVDGEDVLPAEGIPAAGEAWVDSRLLPLLGAELGDTVQVGESELRITKVIVNEPDRGGGMAMVSPRLMMSLSDLEATNVLQPGSRVYYRWLLSGSAADVEKFSAWVEPQLNEHQRLVDLEGEQEQLANALDRGQSYLMLAGIVAVLLAGVAIAITSQHFAARHVDQVALLKSLGASANRVRALYFLQLLILAAFAAAVGLLIGEAVQRFVSSTLQALFPLVMGSASVEAYGIGVLTGLVCLIFFALPPLWHLPTIPPLKVLRREMTIRGLDAWAQGIFGISAVLLLILIYSGDVFLTLAVFLSLAGIIGVSGLFALWLLKAGRKVGMRAGSVWRLALASLQRNRIQSTMQILVFATAIMLLLSMTTVRTSMLEDWQLQLPPDSPNHIFLNISPSEIDSIAATLADNGIEGSDFSPMVRARLTHINGEAPDEAMREENGVLRRELNLSWTDQLPVDDEVVAGEWWKADESDGESPDGVSVEKFVAESLDVEVGDQLRFSVGGLAVDTIVDSIRTVNRDSFEWYLFLAEPGVLDNYSPMYRNDVYLPPDKKMLVNEILVQHPTVMVFEFDKILAQIRSIVDQTSQGIELVLWLVIAAGFVVLLAAVNSSMEVRLLESGLLRALGSRRKLILGAIWAEFSVLGLFAGLIAVLGSEIMLIGLQVWILDVPIKPHFQVWLFGIVIGTLLIGGLGVLSCRKVVTAAPAQVLREIAG